MDFRPGPLVARQTLISGLFLLLAIALTEAFAAAMALSPRRRSHLEFRFHSGSDQCAARLVVAGFPIVQRLAEYPGFFASTFTFWTAIGTLAYWFFSSIRVKRSSASCRLADAECRQQALQAQMWKRS